MGKKSKTPEKKELKRSATPSSDKSASSPKRTKIDEETSSNKAEDSPKSETIVANIEAVESSQVEVDISDDKTKNSSETENGNSKKSEGIAAEEENSTETLEVAVE